MERLTKLKAIFQAALALPNEAERQAYLTATCAGDEELRREVERLLAQDDGAATLVKDTVFDAGGLPAFAAWLTDNDPLVGERLGAYQLTKELGRGGMGAVYLAERVDGAFQQQVAVKLVKRWMDTNFILRRFRQERQILATLNHPFIARLLDGGTTADGLPYFVMEFIEGESLYHFSDERKLSLADRLRLFSQVCEAVHYAHQNQVIHRDLKPSNVMVTVDKTPKLLDFGIAKLLNPELSADTIDPTTTHMRMTPEYASPEQVKGEAVTAPSDIYSLGVLLYELLTGHRPYRFRHRAPHEISRAVCEDEPERPSESLTREDNFAPTGAGAKITADAVLAARNTTLASLRQALAGDLDRIVLKALRKEPAERYQTAAEMARDISNYLEKRPVQAKSFVSLKRQPSTFFPNSAESGTEKRTVAILPMQVIGATLSEDTGELYLGIGLADALILRLSKVPRFVVRPTSSVLRYQNAAVDAFQAGRELEVEFVVEGTIRRIGERIRVSVRLLATKESATQWAQNFDEKFTDVLELEDSISDRIAHSLVPRLTGEEERQIAKRGTNKAEAYEAYLRGRYHWNQFTPESLPKALAAFETAIALDANYALAYVGLADFYIWANIYGLIPSETALAKAEATARRAIGLDNHLADAYASLGLITQNRQRWAEAEKLQQQAIALNPNYIHAHEWYGAQLVGTGSTEQGIQEIKLTERLDPLSLRTKTLLAWTLYQAHRFEEALECAQRIIDLDKNYPQGYSQIGLNLLALGRRAEAVAYFQKFDEMIPASALAKFELCFAYVAVGQPAAARAVLADIKSLAARSYVKPYFLAMAHTALGERDQAFAYFQQSVAEFEPWMLWFGTEPMLAALHADERFVALLQQMNNPLAAQFRAKPRPSEAPKTFAVLPFKIHSVGTSDEDTADRFLGLGLTDALITRLSKVQQLMVRPTSSVLRYAENTDAFQAGRELEADYVLEGYIRRSGERVRVSAQLLYIPGKTVQWAQTFDERFTDVLELEDSIAEKVAGSIIPHLTGEQQRQLSKRGTNSPAAYESFLRGRFYWNLMTEEGFTKAIRYYEQAVTIDPQYALAHASIAEFYIFLGIQCVLPFSECARRAKAAAEQAVAIDASLAEAQTALGIVAINHDFDWQKAETLTARALQLNPNSFAANQWAKTLYLQTGRFAAALQQAHRLLEIAPDSIMAEHFLAWTHYCSRRLDEANAVHQRLVQSEPHYAFARLSYSWSLRCVGDYAGAVAQAQQGTELAPENPMYLTALAAAYGSHGQRAEALHTIEKIQAMAATRYVSPYMLAIAYCGLQDKERAFAALEQALDIRDVWVVWLGVDPQFDVLRNDDQFQELLRRIKHPLAG